MTARNVNAAAAIATQSSAGFETIKLFSELSRARYERLRQRAEEAERWQAERASAALEPSYADDLVTFSRRAHLDPDPWQAALLCSTELEVILNCSRQSGKSSITAVLGVHTALYQPHSLILLLSPGMRQSSELFKKCTAVYSAVGRPVRAESETTLSVTLENGSRIVSLPGTEGTVRGYSGARLIMIDEAAWVMDSLYYAIRPMLAVSGGRLVLMSTPFGKRGFFHHEWTQGGSGWRRFRVTADECPRISREFLDNERRRMPADKYAQEYGCEFGELEGAVFSYEQIQAALDAGVEPLWT